MKLTANKIFIIILLMFTKVDIFCVQYYHEESRNPSDYSNLYKHSVLPSTFHSCIKTAVINAKKILMITSKEPALPQEPIVKS